MTGPESTPAELHAAIRELRKAARSGALYAPPNPLHKAQLATVTEAVDRWLARAEAGRRRRVFTAPRALPIDGHAYRRRWRRR